ncbi:unnamed protein product [Urochloa decumbens]|uniref:S1 motif domain-containing protein n=1 Tax=Urochloa decumbens TaxID=240449 RepID=A0ABC8ZL78_9POAL
MPTPAPAPPCRGLLPPLSKPQPMRPVAKSLASRQAQVHSRARAQPVALARSRSIDDALSAGFVRLLSASPGQVADATGATGGLYDPKPGDFAVGVVVSGTEARLDVAVGANNLATLLAKELLPLDRDGDEVAERAAPPRPGSVGVMAGPAVDEEAARKRNRGSRALVAPGTVVFAEVLGRTLSGRPLLSARRLFRRLAWHRARQIMQLDEPIEVKIYEWNTGGLLTRIEVGCSIRVCIARLDEETNGLIVSEKKAWEMTYLREGTLLQGNVRKIFPYGAQVRIAGTNRSGLLHISNISRGRVLSVSDILKIDDEVKVLVIKSNVPDKIALSTADLESAPGLFLSDREKVFSEAEEMAKRYREQLPIISQNTILDDSLPGETLPFHDEAKLYANWKWFKFLHHNKPDNSNGDLP